MSRHVRVLNVTRGTQLGTAVRVADGWWSRLRGLLGSPALQQGQGLLLVPCRAVHMYGMRQSLDVVFLSREGSVVATYPGLAPGKRTAWHRDSHSVLELPPSTVEATETRPGDSLRIDPAEIREPTPQP